MIAARDGLGWVRLIGHRRRSRVVHWATTALHRDD
jgi:hypothetical protein